MMKENLRSLKGCRIPLLLVFLASSCSVSRESEKCGYQHVVEYTVENNDTINFEKKVFEEKKVLSFESKSGLLNYHHNDNQIDSITNFTLGNSLVATFQYDQKGRKISRTNCDSDLILNTIKFMYSGDSVIWHNFDSEGAVIWKLIQLKTKENQMLEDEYNSSGVLVRSDRFFYDSDGFIVRKLRSIHRINSVVEKSEYQYFYERNECDSVTSVLKVNLYFDSEGEIEQADSLHITRVFGGVGH
jgi:hypothetical protein